MIPYLLMVPLRLALGTLYPAYASYKAIRTKNTREYAKWMMYWVTFAALSSVEAFADVFLGFWCPFYYELKILFLFWLVLPVPGVGVGPAGAIGSGVVYRKLIHPNLMRQEAEIDRWIKRLQNKSYQSVAFYGNKAVVCAGNLIMQLAAKAPAIMAQALALEQLQMNGPLPMLADQMNDANNANGNRARNERRFEEAMDVTDDGPVRHEENRDDGGLEVDEAVGLDQQDLLDHQPLDDQPLSLQEGELSPCPSTRKKAKSPRKPQPKQRAYKFDFSSDEDNDVMNCDDDVRATVKIEALESDDDDPDFLPSQDEGRDTKVKKGKRKVKSKAADATNDETATAGDAATAVTTRRTSKRNTKNNK